MNLTLLTFLLNLIQSRSIDRSHTTLMASSLYSVHSANDKCECKTISVIRVVIYIHKHARTQHTNMHVGMRFKSVRNNTVTVILREKKLRYIVMRSHEYLFMVCLFAYTHNVLVLLLLLLFVCFSYYIYCCV